IFDISNSCAAKDKFTLFTFPITFTPIVSLQVDWTLRKRDLALRRKEEIGV
ncbi:8467_t:CDS:2, partial [Cetraspora pellucida]